MKLFTVWSGFLGVLLSYTVAVGCSSDDSGSGGSASGGDTSTEGKKSSGGSDSGGSDGSGAISGSGGKKSSGGSDSTGGMGGEAMGGLGGMGGDARTEPDNYLENPGFEEGSTDRLEPIPGWEEEGELFASYLEAYGARTGSHKLGHWAMGAFEVSTFQTVAKIPNGTYTFSIWVMRGDNFEAQYLFARDYGGGEMTLDTAAASDSEYVKLELSGIKVTNNQVTVGIYSDAKPGAWASFDDAVLVRE